MKEEVQTALEEIRHNLQSHGGDVELVEVTDEGVVKIRLLGHCAGCPHAQMTIKEGIETHLKKKVPAVKSVQPV